MEEPDLYRRLINGYTTISLAHHPNYLYSMNQNDPLSSLISNDAKSTDRKKLAELLQPYMTIDQESQEFGFHEAFHELDGNDLKVEILLAGAKARALFFEKTDGLHPGEVIATAIMPEGSIKSSLKRLSDRHKIKKDKDGRYFLPAHRIPEMIKRLTSSQNHE